MIRRGILDHDPSGRPCPCGSGRALSECCERYIDGTEQPPTAESLMRSRYTAYTLGRGDYLLATWHPATRPSDPSLDEAISWLGLKILRVEAGDQGDDQGLVEFVARYKVAGRGHRLHEISHFQCIDGQWLYVEGERGATTR